MKNKNISKIENVPRSHDTFIQQETSKGGMAWLQSIDIWPLNLETSRSMSQTKVPMETLMKVYIHQMCERVIDHGLGTMKLNANYFFF